MPVPPIARLGTLSALCVLAAACNKAPQREEAGIDPVIAMALAQPLMGDPDLTGLNRATAVFTGEAVPSAPIPLNSFTDEAKAAARAEAKALVGGSLVAAPPAAGSHKALAGEAVMLSWANAFGDGSCVVSTNYGYGWAAQLPAAWPIYPRGHVQEAAGSDTPQCHLRAISFRTGVAASDVLDFYASLAKKAGLASEHRADGVSNVLTGKRGASGFAVYVRPDADGTVLVDLVLKDF